ncbi:MAG: peroxidase-related enzyme [Deltaproteobacteria bacterium]|nr:peroxidase-related enzyme [Deltaproteobacteria bacterium]
MTAWIEFQEGGHGGPETERALDNVRLRRGKVANVFRAQGLLPHTIAPHLDLYTALMFGPGPLSREDRELVAVVVSSFNDCEYCVAHHSEALRGSWRNDERVRTAARDFRRLPLPRKTQLLLEYAEQLTHKPFSMDVSLIDELREAGAGDDEILQVNLITAYFNFVNRVALGLGVTHTDEEVSGYLDEER